MTIETSPSIENLAAALGRFQSETHGVVRDAVNPFHKNRYATLEAVIETARPGLAKAGLAFLQAPAGWGGSFVELTTMLMHGGSGEWIRFTTSMPIPKPDPQGVGSAITYGCRYALMAMLGLPPMDDDAEATKPQPKPQGATTGAPVAPPTKSSKDIYVKKALERMKDFESSSDLMAWAKTEREKVWPQYGIQAHDEDGQAFVRAFIQRRAVLDELADDPE